MKKRLVTGAFVIMVAIMTKVITEFTKMLFTDFSVHRVVSKPFE